MAKGGISLEFEGFTELYEAIHKAEGEVQPAVEKSLKIGADILTNELKQAMSSTGVSSSLIGRMPNGSVKWQKDVCTAQAGYKKGTYNPDNPSDGYKAVFINYGTPRIKPRNFMQTAKGSASSKIQTEVQKALDEILKELKM